MSSAASSQTRAGPTAHSRRVTWPLVALAAPPLLFLLVAVLAPLLRLLVEGAASMQTGHWAQMLGSTYLRERLLWSVAQALISCALVLALGLPLAWVLARFEFAGRAALLRLLMLPFVTPTLVAAMGVLALFGPRGLAMQWWGLDAQDTPYLLIYGNVFFNLSLVVRAGVDGLSRVSAAQVAAARSLGATPWRAFWRVQWPAVQPWLASSLCLVFLYCFSGFGLALVLGGQRWGTLEVEIYTLVAHELALGPASVLALLSFAVCAAAAWGHTVRETRLATPLRADAIAPQRPQGAWQWSAVWAAVGVLALCCAAPLIAIAWRVLAAGPSAWAVLLQADTLQALCNTLRFSFAALLLATVLGLLHALAVHGARASLGTQGDQRAIWLSAAMLLPLVASPVTVAFGLLLLYPRASATLTVLVGAYALLAYPFVAKAVSTALAALPSHLLHAASSLGASPWRRWWRVTLPLITPSLRRGMAFAAATSLGEFAVTLFLSRPEWTTLSTLIYLRLSRPGRANLDEALVLAALLLALAWAVFALLEPRRASSPTHPLPQATPHHA